MAKIAIISDTHYGVKSDSQIFLDYFTQFYENVFFPKIDELGIKTIIHMGDIVDRRKFINYITLNCMNRTFFDPIRERNIALHVMVGNHDIPYRHSNKLNALGVLRPHDTRTKLYADPTNVVIEGCSMTFIPWINRENISDVEETIAKSSAKIALGHLEIQGADMGGGITAKHGTPATMFSKFDKVLSGHFHKRSVYENIHYIGNPYTVYWDDFGDARGFTILDTETLELEFIVNSYDIFNKIYYTDEGKSFEELMDYPFEDCRNRYCKLIVENRSNPFWFDQFISRIYKAVPANLQIIDIDIIQENFTEEDVVNEAQDTLTIIETYVNNTVSEKIDKSNLMYLFSHLYRESESVEY